MATVRRELRQLQKVRECFQAARHELAASRREELTELSVIRRDIADLHARLDALEGKR